MYVGSTKNINARITSHRGHSKSEDDSQLELHSLMRKNGYEVKQLFVTDYFSVIEEYLWIDIFTKYSGLKVFNKLMGYYGAGRVGRVYQKYWGVPSTCQFSKERRTPRTEISY